MWDGQATIAGVSPFRYSPQQVLRAPDEELPVDLAKTGHCQANRPRYAGKFWIVFTTGNYRQSILPRAKPFLRWQQFAHRHPHP